MYRGCWGCGPGGQAGLCLGPHADLVASRSPSSVDSHSLGPQLGAEQPTLRKPGDQPLTNLTCTMPALNSTRSL